MDDCIIFSEGKQPFIKKYPAAALILKFIIL